jgi:nucleobase:cation symporter-1, NCS1 family
VVAATLVGGLLAVGGAYSAPGRGPFPAGGLIPVLKGLYDYSWVVGFAAGFLIYLVLAPLSARARGATALSTGAAGE